ncbi:MAG: hypothetical protein QNJ12_18200 [Ilumatobacter sp.]|uniref:hypothetical protein n=1 Tax=Ilumatobacter sp. TaxID=1967498 RepID=UPI0026191159|nr:hypothetical protein [Ilumatobacter sp.]MDJ0770731.1 hypothetical protein [Ilumatobacter sp.]
MSSQRSGGPGPADSGRCTYRDDRQHPLRLGPRTSGRSGASDCRFSRLAARADREIDRYLEIVRTVRDTPQPQASIDERPSWVLSQSAFVRHAAAYSARAHIDHQTWHEFGVADTVLARAGIPR